MQSSQVLMFDIWSLLLHGISLAAIMGNLAKIPPQQVFADLGRGRHVESGSAWCRAGIIERFEKFKMAAKMAA